jgi:C1A family cysteine protease
MPHHRTSGWLPDVPDFRDLKYADHYHVRISALPAKVSIRANMSPVRDQGQLGSCTGFSTCAAVEYLIPGTIASPLFVYYEERATEGTIKSDAGANIRTGIKVLNKIGAAQEAKWPYSDGPTKFVRKPTLTAFKDAAKRKLTTYLRCNSRAEVMAALAASKPVVIGFSCYSSLETEAVDKTGIVPMPKKTDRQIGGHAICLTGYDTHAKLFEFKNSWGSSWGDAGYGHLPFGYLDDSNLADDFWCLQNETVAR